MLPYEWGSALSYTTWKVVVEGGALLDGVTGNEECHSYPPRISSSDGFDLTTASMMLSGLGSINKYSSMGLPTDYLVSHRLSMTPHSMAL